MTEFLLKKWLTKIHYKFDINSLLFVRKSDEFTSLLDFNNKESIYYLNELEENSKIFSKIIIKQLIKEDTSYIINYRVNEEDFCFKLSYKEVNVSRLSDGRRKVTSICEVDGFKDDMIVLKEIFNFKQTGLTENGEVDGAFDLKKRVPTVYKR